VTEKIIYQGAEAKIYRIKYKDYKAIEKRRIPKSYRIKEIDDQLINRRTKEETKLIHEARQSGVSVPIIYDVDLKNGIITMEYIQGKRIKDIIHNLSEAERKKIFRNIGKNIARFHNNDIIHGDITTSNIILHSDEIYFIDFGLGEKNNEIESKGVDLHVLMEAIESTHSQYSNCFNYVIEGYKEEYDNDSKLVINKIKDIVKRGRYR